MIPTVYSGSAYLTARAFLLYPRVVPGQPTAVVLNAVTKSEENVNNNRWVLSSVMYTNQNENIEFESGIYDIVAKVSLRQTPFQVMIYLPCNSDARRSWPFNPVYTKKAQFTMNPNLHSWVTFSTYVQYI